MPIFENTTILELARGVKAFLRFEAGLTRGEVWTSRLAEIRGRKSRQGSDEMKDGGQETSQLRKELIERDGRAGGMNPENVVWIFGIGRGGSTWLKDMMGEMPRTSTWNEPLIGELFGDFYDKAQVGQRNARNFILGEPARKDWIPLIRRFTLGSASCRYPRLGSKDYLVIKEPNGSTGAPLIMEALPESRMIFLIRDPRDVVASFLDSTKKGSWLYERKNRGRLGEESLADVEPDAVVRRRARHYLRYITSAERAYEAHQGRKVLVRYEDLRADTLGTMRRIYEDLEIPLGKERLARAVQKYSWEHIPEEDKGPGKKFRKAMPGGWKEDLTSRQVEIIESTTAPLLRKYYSEVRA